jgi:hypothetical protein
MIMTLRRIVLLALVVAPAAALAQTSVAPPVQPPPAPAATPPAPKPGADSSAAPRRSAVDREVAGSNERLERRSRQIDRQIKRGICVGC